MAKRGNGVDLRWLDDVLVLLEEENLTRAAARRNITQPAFSRRIRAFETWLGTPIVDRKTNRVAISPALLSNETEIRALASRLKELRTKVAHFDAASSTVTIAAQHALVHSMFSDLAFRAKDAFPNLSFRLRAGNLSDCVSMFLRGDTNLLLCYEAETIGRLKFGDDVRRASWGSDFLVPIVGGRLRYTLQDNGTVPDDTAAIVYPETSYFGEVLGRANRAFGTPSLSKNVACQTAFSSGILDLVIRGFGVGWVPFSMAYRELEKGSLVSLSNALGKEQLEVAVYADGKSDVALELVDLWSNRQVKN